MPKTSSYWKVQRKPVKRKKKRKKKKEDEIYIKLTDYERKNYKKNKFYPATLRKRGYPAKKGHVYRKLTKQEKKFYTTKKGYLATRGEAIKRLFFSPRERKALIGVIIPVPPYIGFLPVPEGHYFGKEIRAKKLRMPKGLRKKGLSIGERIYYLEPAKKVKKKGI